MKLTQESKNLITFVKKNIHIPKNPLTNESKNYLLTLLKKINIMILFIGIINYKNMYLRKNLKILMVLYHKILFLIY